MQLGSGTTVTHDSHSPYVSSYQGQVDGQGRLHVLGMVYEYHAGPPEDYRCEDAEGVWHIRRYRSDGTYDAFYVTEEPVFGQPHIFHSDAGAFEAVA